MGTPSIDPSVCTPRASTVAPGLNDAMLAGLDLLAVGIALLDAEGAVHFANAAARHCLAALGWGGDAGEAGGAKVNDQLGWRRVLRQACQQQRRHLVELTVDGVSRHAAVVPIPDASGCWVWAVFGRHTLCGPLELQMFGGLNALTLTENQVLQRLSSGHRAQEIAHAQGVAVCTVLTQIASLRSKTVAPSTRDLLATLSRLPPLWSSVPTA